MNRLPMLMTVASLFFFSIHAIGQETGSQEDDRSAIGEHQRLVERKMAELEAKIEIIAQKLEEKEPERAKRLVEALQQAKEKLIAKKMSEITDLLDQQRLTEAEQELDAVILNLEELVRLLLNEKKDSMSRQQEIELLKKWREEIQKIQKEQKRQTKETSKIAHKDKTLADLAEQIKQVEALIKKQQDVIEQTSQNSESGIQALDRVANRQFDVRQETEALAREISGEPEGQPVSTEGEPNQPNDQQPGENQPDENQQKQNPSDANQNQDSANQNSQGNQKPSDSNSSQSGDRQSKPSEQGSPVATEQAPKQPGQKPLEDAAADQKNAEQKLTEGQATDAQRAEERALEDLEDALAELKKEERRIASLPPEAFKEMAKDQRRTGERTADLAKEMSKAPKPSSEEGQPNQGENNQQGSSGQQPGQQSVQRAQQAMQNASQDLGEQEPQAAERQQEKAEEELEKALREIEERLNQLREETREEKLARLEARFREMLARQQVASMITLELDDKSVHLGKLRRRDILTLLRLSTEELEISELGQQAYDLLLEDGTSIVFPEIVLNVHEDLIRVAQLLETEQTGPLTQLIQREIETTLEELLEALKQTRRNSEGGGGGGGGGNAPLLRKSAELKMLRAAQLRVNRMTKQFDLIRSGDTLDEAMIDAVDDISNRQAEIVEMTLRVMEKDE